MRWSLNILVNLKKMEVYNKYYQIIFKILMRWSLNIPISLKKMKPTANVKIYINKYYPIIF